MNGMDAASLDRLHDIVVPIPIPWWPPAPGWYLLGALIVFVLILLIVRQVKLRRANAYRRAAMAELSTLFEDSTSMAEMGTKLREAAEILKRTALAAAPRVDVAKLSGRPWIEWLNKHGKGSVFQDDVARLLEYKVYQSDTSDLREDELSDAMKAIRAWIVHHRIGPRDSRGT